MSRPSALQLPLSPTGRANRLAVGLLVVGLSFLAGCPAPEPGPEEGAGALPAGTELSLLVIDDPRLADAVEGLAGEWSALSGSGLRVSRMSQEELAAAETLDADAIVCPSCQIGDVAARTEIVPIPDPMLEDEEGTWPGIFSLLRVREAVWGKETVGVPLGAPVLVVYCRADLLEKLGRKPPATWEEYQELAELLSDRSKLGDAAPPDQAAWHATAEPLAPGWAGLVLLARAAPYVSHRENYSTMLRIDDMEPLIDGPPFVRALEELVAAASLAPPEQLEYDPAAVRSAFWQGRCGMALTWPSAAEPVPEAVAAAPPKESEADAPAEQVVAEDEPEAPDDEDRPERARMVVGLAKLPGSSENYDMAEKAWEPRRDEEPTHVPLLGTAGRLGLVAERCPYPQAAFRLLFWLSDEQSDRVCPASPATTLFRTAHVQSPGVWVEEPMPRDVAAAYAETTQQTLCEPAWMYALRVPGRQRYLAALDQAVHRAVRGEQTPEESLREAAEAWREITEAQGRKRQRKAYWKSIGLE